MVTVRDLSIQEIHRLQHLPSTARDEAARSFGRPPGCWCFGLGHDNVHMPLKEASSFCVCEIGVNSKAEWQELKKTERALQNRIIQRRQWEAACIPARFKDCRFETSPLMVAMPELIAALRWPDFDLENDPRAEAWMDRYNRSWFFWGDYGTGKTALAISVMAQDMDWQVLFATVPDVLSELRSTYGRRGNTRDDEEDDKPTEADVIRKYAEFELLVLDDLGAEQIKNSEWLADRLYQIIGKRHAEKKRTIFTSNLDLAGVAARIGERITWRILEMCGADNVVHVVGSNQRDTK